jgi:hypothetical protein
VLALDGVDGVSLFGGTPWQLPTGQLHCRIQQRTEVIPARLRKQRASEESERCSAVQCGAVWFSTWLAAMLVLVVAGGRRLVWGGVGRAVGGHWHCLCEDFEEQHDCHGREHGAGIQQGD